MFNSLPEDKQRKFWHTPRDLGLGVAPYVNIVEKVVETVGTPQYDKEEEEEDDDDEGGEAISFKVDWQSAIPDVYVALNQAPGAF